MTYRTTLITLTLALGACGSTPITDTLVESPVVDHAVGEADDVDTDAPIVAVDVAEMPTDAGESIVPLDVAEMRSDADDGVEPLPPTASFTLRRGETLAHFARWSGLPVEVIAETSGLDLFDTFDVGTDIRVPVSAEARAELVIQRDLHHVRRAEGYLAARGGAVGTEFYTVQTGDSAWTIARDQRGIPVWLLETYNPSADLAHLRPGEELMVPIIADIVVDAGDEEQE